MSALNTQAAAEKLVLTGSSTIAPLAMEIGKRFSQLYPDIRVDVQTGGSSRGVADARTGLNDIGMASRALKSDELDLMPFTIAMDGVAIIIHKDNPIAALSTAQIKAIYTGEITDWAQINGTAGNITVVHKAAGHSTLELFLAFFNLKNSQIKPHIIIGDNQQGIKTVAGNRNSIGYVSIGTAEYEINHNTPIKLLPIAGVSASTENVTNGTFKLSRPLNLITSGEPSPLAKRFIAFAQSLQINDLIQAQYFVPIAH